MSTTFWGKTDFGEKRDLGPPWELEYHEGKGYFAIATRDFAAGEFICKEKPTTFTAGWHPFDESQTKILNNDLEKISEEEQRAFFELANVFPECDPAAGIYMTNSFDMAAADNTAESSCGMYLAIARLNHSCRPNAQQTHIPETKEEVLYATRPIARGEELCDCYIELRQDTAARQKELMEYFRFVCCCSACTEREKEAAAADNGDVSIGKSQDVAVTSSQSSTASDDVNRVAAMKLDKKMMKLAEEGQVQKALNCAMKIIKVLEDPRSLGWGERYLAEAHLYVVHFSGALFREGYDQRRWREAAESHAQKAYSLNLRLQGPLSPDTMRSLDYVRDIEHLLNGG